ncbi:hypothetical protein CRYUN_Cryun16bG0046500 [Craigia yunnanensis]
MVESKQGDARIYIVSTLFFACIVAGGTFLCLYIFRPEAEYAPWYPLAGIILVGIPWIFWIGPVARSMHSLDNEDSLLKSPNGDHRHVHFGEVVVLGSSKYNQNDNGGESLYEDAKGYPETEHEGIENSYDSIASDKDHVSVACRKGEAPLIVLVST